MLSSRIAQRLSPLGAGLALALGSAGPVLASHDIFHVFTPAITQGEWGAEALSAFSFGLPSAHDGEEGHGAASAAHELAVHRDMTSFWMAKIALGLQRMEGDGYDVTSIASENVFRLWEPRDGAFDFAWFTALAGGIGDGNTNAIEFGPVLSWAAGRTTVIINPFFEKTFGANHEDGIALTYGWRATYEVSELFSVGVEGYGAVENLADAAPVNEQTHRIGPVLYLGHVHGNPTGVHGAEHSGGHAHEHGAHGGGDAAPEWHGEVGVLFGLTDATPDTTLKVNLGADF